MTQENFSYTADIKLGETKTAPTENYHIENMYILTPMLVQHKAAESDSDDTLRETIVFIDFVTEKIYDKFLNNIGGAFAAAIAQVVRDKKNEDLNYEIPELPEQQEFIGEKEQYGETES